MENPISHEKLRFLADRSRYNDSIFGDIWSCLKELTFEQLAEKKATWQRKCYQEAIHVGKLKRVKDRYEFEADGTSCTPARRKCVNSLEGKLTRH